MSLMLSRERLLRLRLGPELHPMPLSLQSGRRTPKLDRGLVGKQLLAGAIRLFSSFTAGKRREDPSQVSFHDTK